MIFLMLACSLALTQPRPSQTNANQVRIGLGDNRRGTLVRGDQIQDGRHVVPLRLLPQMYGVPLSQPVNTDVLVDSADTDQLYYWPPTANPETRVICVRVPGRVDVAALGSITSYYGPASWGDACYTEFGQGQLLSSRPDFAAWYAQAIAR